MRKLELWPRNKDHFLGLLNRARDLGGFCEESGFIPVVYGSVAFLCHTAFEDIEIEDVDFLVPMAAFECLTERLSKRSEMKLIRTPYNSLNVLNGSSKISFGASEHYLPDLFHRNERMVLNGFPLCVLEKDALKEAYLRGSQTIPVKSVVYLEKLRLLKEQKNC